MSRPDDLIGQTFNYLTVISKDLEYKKLHNISKSTTAVYWKCKCICGNLTSVRGDALKKGSIKSCGCMHTALQKKSQMIDMTGQKFGKITILEPDFLYAQQHHIKNNGNVVYWKYRCECGTIHTAPGNDIRVGKIKSCPNCSISRGEEKIKELLDKENIKYLHNTNYFKDLKNPETDFILKYDFIIFNSEGQVSYLIEFDGEQHFKPVDHFGGIVRFKQQQQLDNIKNTYAFEHNLPLIRIPYNQYNKLTYADIDIQTSTFIYHMNSGY